MLYSSKCILRRAAAKVRRKAELFFLKSVLENEIKISRKNGVWIDPGKELIFDAINLSERDLNLIKI